MKEMIGERVLSCLGRKRKPRRVVMTHRQTLSIADDGETVHAPAVYLCLLLVEPVDKVASGLVARNELLDCEGSIWKIRRQMRIRRLGQHRERLPRQINLAVLAGAQTNNAIGARKLTVKIVEAPVLEIQNDDVIDVPESVGRSDRCRRGSGLNRGRGACGGNEQSRCRSGGDRALEKRDHFSLWISISAAAPLQWRSR